MRERTPQEKVFILIYLIALTIILLIRLRLLSTPFERDEGEYAYIAQTLAAWRQPVQRCIHHEIARNKHNVCRMDAAFW